MPPTRTATTGRAPACADSTAHPPSPPNPFLLPTPQNHDLSYLTHGSDLLPFVVEFYENRRRLRESLLLRFTKTGPSTPGVWETLVREASAQFHPEDWMLPLSSLQSPALIQGIYDHIPIPATSPEIYSETTRRRMHNNGQHPWMISVTVNTRWHTPESFLRWVHDLLIPEISKSARTIALTQFPSPTRRRPALRQPRRTPDAQPVALAPDALRHRLLAIAAHQIRHCAPPGEPLAETFSRYCAALPRGADAGVTPDSFARRLRAVATQARAEWAQHFAHEKRLRAALASGLLHLIPTPPAT